MEVERVGHLAVGEVVRARLRLRDALVADGVRAQIRRRVAVLEARALLQAAHERGGAARIEAGCHQSLEADAVGLVFVFAGEVELLLHGQRLRARDGGLHAVGAARASRARGQHGEGEPRERHQHGALLIVDHPRHVPLRDVRHLVGEHARELGLVLREEDETGVDTDVAAREGEGVDGVVGNREELEVLLGIAGGHDQAKSELVQVVVDLRVLQVPPLGADLAHHGLADLALLGRREGGLGRVPEVGQREHGRGVEARARQRRPACVGNGHVALRGNGRPQ